MRRIIRSVERSFNWDVVIRLALVPAVSYVLLGAALGGRAAERVAPRGGASAEVSEAFAR